MCEQIKVLYGDPACDECLEAGLDFMPLHCVDPEFANSCYFSQESCQRNWEFVACSVTKTVFVPSPEVNTRWCCHPPITRLTCSFPLFVLLRMFKTNPLWILFWWNLHRSLWDTEENNLKHLSGSLAQTSRVKLMLHESYKQRCHDVYLRLILTLSPGKKFPRGQWPPQLSPVMSLHRRWCLPSLA